MIHDAKLELDLMVMLAREVAAAPDVPAAAATYFRHMAETFTGTRAEFLAHVQRSAPGWFPSVGPRPRWPQSENWLWGNDGKPMTFLGQLDIAKQSRAFPWDSTALLKPSLYDGLTNVVALHAQERGSLHGGCHGITGLPLLIGC